MHRPAASVASDSDARTALDGALAQVVTATTVAGRQSRVEGNRRSIEVELQVLPAPWPVRCASAVAASSPASAHCPLGQRGILKRGAPRNARWADRRTCWVGTAFFEHRAGLTDRRPRPA